MLIDCSLPRFSVHDHSYVGLANSESLRQGPLRFAVRVPSPDLIHVIFRKFRPRIVRAASVARLPFRKRRGTGIRPSFSQHDHAYVLKSNTVPGGNGLLSFAAIGTTPDVRDLLRSELGQTVPLAPVILPVAYPVWTCVLFTGSPADVLWPAVILLASWPVKSFHAWWPRLIKGFQHQMMHESGPHLVFSAERHRKIAVRPDMTCQNLPATESSSRLPWQRSNPPQVTDLVEALVADDRQPSLGITHASQCIRRSEVRG